MLENNKFTSGQLLKAQRALIIEKLDNQLNGEVLETISVGDDSGSIASNKTPPDWVLDALRERHPDLDLSYDPDSGVIKYVIINTP